MRLWKKGLAEKLLSQLTCKKVRVTTKPINNTGLGFKRQVLCIFRMSRNLWDFALDKKKINQNQKIALCAWRKANASLLPYCS